MSHVGSTFFGPFSRLPSCYSSSTTTICLLLLPWLLFLPMLPPQVRFVGGSAHDCTSALFAHLKTCTCYRSPLCWRQCRLGALATACGHLSYSYFFLQAEQLECVDMCLCVNQHWQWQPLHRMQSCSCCPVRGWTPSSHPVWLLRRLHPHTAVQLLHHYGHHAGCRM